MCQNFSFRATVSHCALALPIIPFLSEPLIYLISGLLWFSFIFFQFSEIIKSGKSTVQTKGSNAERSVLFTQNTHQPVIARNEANPNCASQTDKFFNETMPYSWFKAKAAFHKSSTFHWFASVVVASFLAMTWWRICLNRWFIWLMDYFDGIK